MIRRLDPGDLVALVANSKDPDPWLHVVLTVDRHDNSLIMLWLRMLDEGNCEPQIGRTHNLDELELELNGKKAHGGPYWRFGRDGHLLRFDAGAVSLCTASTSEIAVELT